MILWIIPAIALAVLGLAVTNLVLLLRYSAGFMLARGNSMKPALPSGVLLVPHIPPGDIRPGDIITIRSPDPDYRWETHRVIATKHDAHGTVHVRTKGDNVPRADPWVERDAVVGEVATYAGEPLYLHIL